MQFSFALHFHIAKNILVYYYAGLFYVYFSMVVVNISINLYKSIMMIIMCIDLWF